MNIPSGGGIATEHAILVEASAAGEWQAIPEAVLFGILLGVLYDGFRILAASLGLPSAVDAHAADSRLSRWTQRLRTLRRRRITDSRERGDSRMPRFRIPGFVLQLLLDLLYFLLCGILGAVFLYWRSDGILRWYLVLAGIMGFSAYYTTVGVFVMRVCGLTLALLRAAGILFCNRILYLPLRGGYLLGKQLLRLMRAAVHRIGQRWAAAWTHARTAKKPGGGKQRKSTKSTEQRKGILWQRKKSSRRRRSASSRKSRSSSSSDSAASPSSG